MKHIEIRLQSSALQISICFAGRVVMISSSIDSSYVLQHIRLRSFAVNFQLINLREVRQGEKNDKKTATFKISSLMA